MDVSPHMQPKRLALTQGEAGKLDPDGDGHPIFCRGVSNLLNM